MAMVVRANRESPGIGGHISTYASAATLLEVGFNHFFHSRTDEHSGDLVYFQGHASPGVYGRAFLEGRLSEQDLSRFRREYPPGKRVVLVSASVADAPSFWQFPTVSMGLGPIMAIYQARFFALPRAPGHSRHVSVACLGVTSETGKSMNRKPWEHSHSPRARSSTT